MMLNYRAHFLGTARFACHASQRRPSGPDHFSERDDIGLNGSQNNQRRYWRHLRFLCESDEQIPVSVATFAHKARQTAATDARLHLLERLENTDAR
jgi:hypothetical protein